MPNWSVIDMITASIRFLTNNLMADLTCRASELQQSLQNIGVLTPPSLILLDNARTLQIHLSPNDEAGQIILSIINTKSDTLGNVQRLCRFVYCMNEKDKNDFLNRIENGEMYLYGMHISPYEKGNIFNKDPLRVRKLLLHKSEINKLAGQIKMKGYTLMPLKVYFKGSLVKVEIALAKGKKLYDKRQDIAKKDMRREAERDFKVKNLY